LAIYSRETLQTNDQILSRSTPLEQDSSSKKALKHIVLVQKISKDYAAIKSIVDKNMVKTFSKMRFLKPKANEIECESIQIYYDSFLIANTKYVIDYYKKREYCIDLDDNVKEVLVFDQNIKPTIVEAKSGIKTKPKKQIIIDSKERINLEISKQIALNRKGRIINRKDLPSAPCESDPIKFLDEYGLDVRHPEVNMWEILKKEVMKRPPDISEVIDENFQVTHQVLIFTPVYEARIINLSTHEIRIIPISGVTGKIFVL
jgi:hypothetical protein